MSIELVMLSNHLTFYHSLLFLLLIFPSIRVFSHESALCIRRPKSQSFGQSFQWILSADFPQASLVPKLVKNPPAMLETWVQSLGWEDPLEQGKATHSSILAWRIPWIVCPWGSQKVRHDWATFTPHVYGIGYGDGFKCACMHMCSLASVVSDSLWPDGL